MSKIRTFAVAAAMFALPVLAGCSSSSTSSGPGAVSYVYYSTDEGALGDPGLGVVGYPITSTSTLAGTVAVSATNLLDDPNPLAVDSSGRLFVANCCAIPATINVFSLPLSAGSVPTITLTLPATASQVYDLMFDASGNLWVPDATNGNVYKFTGPFTTSATLAASITLPTTGCGRPEGLGFDSSGNLYAACENNVGGLGNSVAVWTSANIVTGTAPTYFLVGPAHPEALIFDSAGNLYVGSHAASPNGGIAQFLKTDLASGDAPTLYNSTGMDTNPFPAQFAIDAAGNIYDADCGNTAHIFVYPLASFSATTAPTASYSDANILLSNCVAGIAIH